jgi:hypothetical protein
MHSSLSLGVNYGQSSFHAENLIQYANLICLGRKTEALCFGRYFSFEVTT